MWNSLFEDESRLRAEKNELIENLKNKESMIQFLLEQNKKFKADNDILEFAKSSNLNKIAEIEKSKQAMLRENMKSQEELKIESKLREGLTKKCHKFEFESIGLRDEKTNLLDAQKIDQNRIKELESALNDERSKRLRDIHEIDILRKQLNHLSKKELESENEILEANKSILKSLERTDIILTKSDLQQRMLTFQNEETSTLSTEVNYLREEVQRLLNEVATLTASLTEKTYESQALQKEVWRLSQEQLVNSISQTGKSRALFPSRLQLQQERAIESFEQGQQLGITDIDALNSFYTNSIASSVLPSAGPSTSCPTMLSLLYNTSNNNTNNTNSSSSSNINGMMNSKSSPSLLGTRLNLSPNSRASPTTTNASSTNRLSSPGLSDDLLAGTTLKLKLAELSVSSEFSSSALSPVNRARGLQIGLRPGLVSVSDDSKVSDKLRSKHSSKDNRDGRQLYVEDVVEGRSYSNNSHNNQQSVVSNINNIQYKGKISTTTVSKKEINSSEHNMKQLQELSTRPKTTYLGSGLGIRKETGWTPQGSAKEMLRRTLAERDLL